MPEFEHHGPFDSAGIANAYEIARYQVEVILRPYTCLADREDVVARAIERAWAKRSRLRTEHGFAGWVARIARNAAFDWLRARRETLSLEAIPDPADLTTPERECRRAQLRRALLLALAELPEAQREVFILREVDGLSYDEIAMERGISPNTVGPTLAAARERLRESLRFGVTA